MCVIDNLGLSEVVTRNWNGWESIYLILACVENFAFYVYQSGNEIDDYRG